MTRIRLKIPAPSTCKRSLCGDMCALLFSFLSWHDNQRNLSVQVICLERSIRLNRNMELIALRTFQAVVEEGGILAASRKLNTVQSNVTGRIRKLEEELGTELFFRKGRGLELAPSGRVLLDYARRMLQLEQQTTAAVRQVGESSGELRIGAMETFAALHLPTALKAVRSEHPRVELRVFTEPTAVLVDKVLDHKLDCAFVAGPVIHPDLEF